MARFDDALPLDKRCETFHRLADILARTYAIEAFERSQGYGYKAPEAGKASPIQAAAMPPAPGLQAPPRRAPRKKAAGLSPVPPAVPVPQAASAPPPTPISPPKLFFQ